MDGGVLDNAPFEPVLEAIQRRPIDGPWRRVLAYVVPSGASSTLPAPPTDVEAQPDESLPDQPGVAQVVGAVVNAWRESDSRLDAEALNQHRAAATRTDFTAERLIDEARHLNASPSPAWLNAALPLFDTYKARRMRALETFMNPGATWLVPSSLAVDATEWTWGDAVALKILRWWGRELNQLGAAPVALAKLGEVQARAVAVSEAIARIHGEVATMLAGPSTTAADLAATNGPAPQLDPRVSTSLASLHWLMAKGAQMYAAALRGDPIPSLDAPLDTGAIGEDGSEHLDRALKLKW